MERREVVGEKEGQKLGERRSSESGQGLKVSESVLLFVEKEERGSSRKRERRWRTSSCSRCNFFLQGALIQFPAASVAKKLE